MNSLTSRWTRMPTGARTLRRAAAVSFVSAVAVLSFAGPAMADTTIPLHEAHKGTTAATFKSKQCDDKLPQTPGKDGWHFVLPASGDPDAEFTSLTLTYTDSEGGSHTVTVPPDGTINGMHAYVFTPAGWTLADGTATITSAEGEGPDDFVLSHVCPAPTATPTPSATGSTGPSQGPSDSPSNGPSDTPTGSTGPSQGPSDTPTGSESPSTPGGPGELPVTGLAIGGMVLTGLGLVGAGAAMRAVRRRNTAAEATDADGDADDADDKQTDV